MKIPLFKIGWKQEDIDAIASVIKRGGYWTQGPEVEEFEDMVAYLTQTDYAVACCNGTAGLHLALLSAGIKEGDEVIVPSYTFISTVNTIRFVGATPVFADIEKNSYGLDIMDVKSKLTSKTKAIIVVHYGGCPAVYIKELTQLAKEEDIVLIEDAAASLGAIIDEKPVGSFGDYGVFSFCQNKNVTAGEGGMVVTNSKKSYNKLKLLVSHGQTESNYTTLGYNFRLSSINAALGNSQLKRIYDISLTRRTIALAYNKALSKIREIDYFQEPHNCYNVYWIYPVFVKKELKKPLMDYLAGYKIATKSYYTPVHLTTLYDTKEGYDLPVTEEVYDSSFCLPMYPTITTQEIDFITGKIKKFFEGR